MTNAFDLSGSVALLTGGAGGIGRASVAALAAAGATVIATDLAPDAAIDGAAAYKRLDATDEAGWEVVLADIERDYGRLDILVNNAGISVTNSISDTSLTEFRRCMTVNVESVFLGTRAALDLLARSGRDRPGGSSVINLSSVAGLRGGPYMSTYCASKGAVKLHSKSAALEFAALKLPIRVNSVHPGAIDTVMMENIYTRYVEEGLFPDLAKARAKGSAGHAMKRMGTADEIADGIVYLAAPASRFVTGSELVIDGGMTAD